MQDRSVTEGPRTTGAIFLVIVLAWFVMPILSADAETPLWKLGIPTFSGKNPEQKAQEGPSFSFPAPNSDLPAQPNGAAAVALPGPPATVAQAESVADHLDFNPTVAAVDFQLPIPDLPEGAALQFPLAPGDPAMTDLSVPIGQAIASGDAAETAPLEEATQSWYTIPWTWVTQGWKNHAELGLDGSSGNSRTLALQTGLEMKRKTDRYTLGLDFDYRKATNRGITTEDNGRLNLDYDRMFQDSKWSAFGKFGAEWDQFKAFDSRLNLNSGLGYYFIRTDDAMFAVRFGAGASKEIGAPDDAWKPEAVFGTEAEYQVNRYNKLKGKVDYFPAWEDFSDFRLVSDVGWEILLDDKDNLSLKLSLTDRYDSTPQGARPNDVYYSLLLLVKF